MLTLANSKPKMKEMRLSDRFIEFEKKNNLFNLTDNNGIYIWDIIRFELYVNLMWDFKKGPIIKKNYKKIFQRLSIQITDLLTFQFRGGKYDNFFYLCSRNEKQGLLFDQNAFSTLEQFDQSKTLKFETWVMKKEKLLFKDSFYHYPQLFYRKIFKSNSKFDYSLVINKIIEEFGICPLNEMQLKMIVHDFYSDASFFKKLFIEKGIKNIFVTQNGIQKGLFFAAAGLNIPTFEFQHGIVDHGHLAYSYPDIKFKRQQVYLPDVIFSFSSYWFSDLDIPFVKIYPLGNDFFSKEVTKLGDNTAITVISADVFGMELQEFLLENINLPILRDTKIYFKLHPNQFGSKEHFENIFKPYPNIEVIAKEYSIQRLLEKTRILITIQSTAVYEALQAGRKVILLKRSTYERHQDIFDNSNVHLVSNANDLTNAINAPIDKNIVEFFSNFNNEVLQAALAQYNN